MRYFEKISPTNFKIILSNSLQNYISVVVLPIEGLVQVIPMTGTGHWSFCRALLSNALRKELVITPFKGECSQTVFSVVFNFPVASSYNEQYTDLKMQ